MFGQDYTGACPGCSNLADHFDGGVVHLNHRDVTFLCISRAPIEKLQAYKRRMGWTFPLERLRALRRRRPHTYTRQAPDRNLLAPYYYQLLDQVPKGRGDEVRVVRHDEYA